jgi:hypothetical protein
MPSRRMKNSPRPQPGPNGKFVGDRLAQPTNPLGCLFGCFLVVAALVGFVAALVWMFRALFRALGGMS